MVSPGLFAKYVSMHYRSTSAVRSLRLHRTTDFDLCHHQNWLRCVDWGRSVFTSRTQHTRSPCQQIGNYNFTRISKHAQLHASWHVLRNSFIERISSNDNRSQERLYKVRVLTKFNGLLLCTCCLILTYSHDESV